MSDELLVDDSVRSEPDRSWRLDWYYVGGVTGFHLLALLAFLPWFFSWTGVLLVPLGMYVFGTLGICVGFHRLLTHRSFSCPRWLERTLVLLGTCCVMESPPYWVAIHRQHHQFADEEPDPHSPLKSFFWSHFGWYMVRIDPTRRAELLQRYAKDVMRDPLYAFLERNHNWVALIVMSWVAFFAIGWGVALAIGASTADAIQFGTSVLIWGVFVRSVEVFHATMSVNSFTHLWGYRNYETSDNSRNNFWVAMISTGEGWHNNHHADPRAARHGHARWEFDIAWLTIRLLERIGLAWDASRPAPNLAALRISQDDNTSNLNFGRAGDSQGAPPRKSMGTDRGVVLITGAGAGIGRQLAIELAGRGWKVAGIDRNQDRLQNLDLELGNERMGFAWGVADVREAVPLREEVDKLAARLGPIDLLIACAGTAGKTPALGIQAECIANIIDTNLIGVSNTIAAVLPGMLERRRGHVVAISSLASFRGLPAQMAYCASKTGLNTLMQSLWLDVKEHGIFVTTVCPGHTRTSQATGIYKDIYLMPVEKAVNEILKAIDRRKRFHAFPRRLVAQLWGMQLLPAWLQERLLLRRMKRLYTE